ncbi:MAG: hypothetical protein ACPGUD_02185 [Parashewanella sp.]
MINIAFRAIGSNTQTSTTSINKLNVGTPSSTAKNISTQANEMAVSAQNQSFAAISNAQNPSAEEIASLKKFQKELFELHHKGISSSKALISETKSVLEEIAQERPELLNKEFDFTHNGEEIDIVDHDLTKREYNYLKAKFNANDELVEATVFLNKVAAHARKADTQDIEGRLRLMSIVSKAEQRTAEYFEMEASDEPLEYHDPRALYAAETHLNAFYIMQNGILGFRGTV